MDLHLCTFTPLDDFYNYSIYSIVGTQIAQVTQEGESEKDSEALWYHNSKVFKDLNYHMAPLLPSCIPIFIHNDVYLYFFIKRLTKGKAFSKSAPGETLIKQLQSLIIIF